MKTFLNLSSPDVLSVGAGPEAQSILKRMEREATHRYQTLTLPEDKAANCLFVNGTLVHRGKQEAPKSQAVRTSNLNDRHFGTVSKLLWINTCQDATQCWQLLT